MGDLIRAGAASSPHAPALVAVGRKPLTYGALAAQIDAMGASLAALGVGQRGRVAIVAPSGPQLGAAILGVSSYAIAAPLNSAAPAHELRGLLLGLNPCALLVPAEFATPAREVASQLGVQVIEFSSVEGAPAGAITVHDGGGPAALAALPTNVDDPCLILHTSGTTGQSRRVLLTHANLTISARTIAQSLELGANDRCLDPMPLHHSHGLIGGLFASIAAGASVLCPSAYSATDLLDWITSLAPTWYTAVPTVHRAVLEALEDLGGGPLHHQLRFIRSCSAPLSPELEHKMEAVLGVPVIQAYGMTETSHQLASNRLPPAARKPGSVGLPTGVEIKVVDAAGYPLGHGQQGEVVVRGPLVMAGYMGDPAATASALAGDWLRSGDVGHLDEDGYLFLDGRLKEMIDRGGESISPNEIDSVLLMHPDVIQAAAFGVPHPRLGEDVSAAVAVRKGARLTEGELRSFVAERLAATKVPSRIAFMEQIPVTSTGKPERAKLARDVAARSVALPSSSQHVPTTPVEQALAGIWRAVLRVPGITLDQHFFADLGGDSLRAMQVAVRVAEALWVEVPAYVIFEHPTLAEFCRAVEHALEGGVTPADRSIRASANEGEDGPLPSSYAQQGIWLSASLRPDDRAYNSSVAARLRGPIDAAALEQAWHALGRRHAVLRTRFEEAPEGFVQVIEPGLDLCLTSVELASEADALRLAAIEAQQPFDLKRGPLARATLFRLRDDDHLLVVSTHHIVVDGWSWSILTRELAALYQHALDGTGPGLAPLNLQFADFAAWQRDYLLGPNKEALLNYWTNQLAGAPHRLELAANGPLDGMASGSVGLERFRLDAADVAELRRVGQPDGATLFMLLLAVFQSVLSRHTAQTDFLIGAPVAGRPLPETEALIGCFANLLPLRARLEGDPTFRDIVAQVRATTLSALKHQDLPFEEIVHAVHAAGTLGHAPLVQATYTLNDLPDRTLRLPGVGAEAVSIEPGGAKFNLSLSFTLDAGDGSLAGVLEYRADLFSARTVQRIATEIEAVTRTVARDPDSALSRLGTPGESGAAPDFSMAVREFPTWSIHQRFTEQAGLRPDAIAVKADGESLTYAQLEQRSNQLAHYLRTVGVGQEVLVGLCLERSLDLIVGIIGILKSGGAYLPLDPAYPPDRLAFMLADAGAPAVVTTSSAAERLAWDQATVVRLDTDSASIASQPTSPPTDESSPDDLAYVIYTSGSTGRPKGVMVTHANVARLFTATEAWFQFGPKDVWTLFHSYAFDFSVWELWGALLFGGRLIVVPYLVSRAPDAFLKLLHDEGVTVLNQTPSAFRQLMLAEAASDPRPDDLALRLIVFGGEALDPSTLGTWINRHGDQRPRLVNMYGITETTVHATYRPVKRADLALAFSPIGVPIPDLQVYVLDDRGQPVTLGAPGEMYVGGAGLARGYLNWPELTSERFVANPFDARAGARMYRTGDRVRGQSDGALEYLGRIDRQIKIRGFRIEPGEVEAALEQHPSVDDALVVARMGSTREALLVGYVLTPGASLSAAELRQHLLEHVPEHMVPSAFVSLPYWPLTPNGKIDVTRLPPPDVARLASGTPYAAPRTPTEECLVGLFEQVLGVQRVGIHDASSCSAATRCGRRRSRHGHGRRLG